jgi:hypothetical protein
VVQLTFGELFLFKFFFVTSLKAQKDSNPGQLCTFNRRDNNAINF